MGRIFGRASKGSPSENASTPDYSDNDYQKRDLYKQGVNHMSSDKMKEAIISFELALRHDPEYVDAWIKKGLAHFHLGEYNVSIACYDKALEIDVDIAEAWTYKGLSYYKMKNYEKAIECCEKATDINPTDGMAWYNKACYLTLNGRIDEGLDALKRSIEIDIDNARRAVKDRDFEGARAEEGYRRIVEVVVLESIRQGYDYVGKIVWTTGMDRIEIEDALMRLGMKGLVRKIEKKGFTGKDEYYELTKEIADKVGVSKRTGLFHSRQVSAPVQQLKDISEVIGKTKDAVERGNLEEVLSLLDELVNPLKHGNAMLEQFFEDHRDLRLYKAKLHNGGQVYLNANKATFVSLLTKIDGHVRNFQPGRIS